MTAIQLLHNKQVKCLFITRQTSFMTLFLFLCIQWRAVSLPLPKLQLTVCPVKQSSTWPLDWRVIDSCLENTYLQLVNPDSCPSQQHVLFNSMLTLLSAFIHTSAFGISWQTGLVHVFEKQWSQQLTVTQISKPRGDTMWLGLIISCSIPQTRRAFYTGLDMLLHVQIGGVLRFVQPCACIWSVATIPNEPVPKQTSLSVFSWRDTKEVNDGGEGLTHSLEFFITWVVSGS